MLSAKKLSWAPEIDGEILINDTEIEDIKYGQVYRAEITSIAEDKLIGIVKI